MKTDIWDGNKTALEKLQDDDLYYGEYGQQWLSASTLKKYLNTDCPKERPMNQKALQFGHAFHQCILEPDKYAERTDLDVIDRDHIDFLKKSLENSYEFGVMDDLKAVETPYIGTFDGIPIKCKVDAENDEVLIDLKTTSNIDAVQYTAKHFGYHLSAYQYWILTRKVMWFLYVEKNSGKIKLVKPDRQFYVNGQRDWRWAMRNYRLSKKKHWQFMGLHDNLPQGRFKLDSVHMSGEENRLYAWILQEQYLNKRKR